MDTKKGALLGIYKSFQSDVVVRLTLGWDNLGQRGRQGGILGLGASGAEAER